MLECISNGGQWELKGVSVGIRGVVARGGSRKSHSSLVGAEFVSFNESR